MIEVKYIITLKVYKKVIYFKDLLQKLKYN